MISITTLVLIVLLICLIFPCNKSSNITHSVLDNVVYQVKKILKGNAEDCSTIFRCDRIYCPIDNINVANYFPVQPIIIIRKNNVRFPKSYLKYRKYCSIVIYRILKYDEETIGKSWISSLPGSFRLSFHIILYPDASFNKQLLEEKSLAWRIMIYKFFIVLAQEHDNYSESDFVCQNQSNSAIASNNFQIYIVSIMGNLAYEIPLNKENETWKTLNHRHWENFYGEALIIPVRVASKLKSMEKSIRHYRMSRNSPYYKLADIVELTDRLNATTKFITTQYKKHGTGVDSNGNWKGTLRPLVEGTAHILQVTITRNRSRYVDFSRVYDHDNFMFVTEKPKQIALHYFFFLEAFQAPVWLSYWALAMLLFLCLCLVSQKLLFEYLAIIFRPVLEQPVFVTKKFYREFYCNHKIRILLFSWFLSKVVIISVWKSFLISILLTPNLEYPPDNFAHLVTSSYKILTFGYKGFSEEEILEEMKNISIASSVANKLEEVENNKECFMNVRNGHSACAATIGSLLNGASNYLINANGETEYQVSKDYLFTTCTSVAISKEFPHIKGPVDRFVGQLIEGGIYTFWDNDMFRLKTLESRRSKRLERKEKAGENHSTGDDAKAEALKSKEFYNIMYVFLSGIGISVCSFLFEKGTKLVMTPVIKNVSPIHLHSPHWNYPSKSSIATRPKIFERRAIAI